MNNVYGILKEIASAALCNIESRPPKGGPKILVYMIAGRRLSAPTPHGMVALDSFLKLMISVRIPCYRAPSETFSSGGVLERGFLTQVDGFLMESLLERVS